MGDIKSAREIAMEKIARLGEATDEERLRWKYIPEGEMLAARYLNEDSPLSVELKRYEEAAKPYVIEGVSGVLIRNINLPRNEAARGVNRRAMEGLKSVRKDKIAVENVFSQIRHIFNHYQEQGEQQRKQAYSSLKAEFEARVQQALKQQIGSFAGVKINVEKQPQFQEEWRTVQAQLDSQYLKLLDEYKQELRVIH